MTRRPVPSLALPRAPADGRAGDARRAEAPAPLRADGPPPPASLSGWGRCPVVPAHRVAPADLPAAAEALRRQGEGIAPRGLGRAYGDAALPPASGPGLAVETARLDRLHAFDPETGVLVAESGVSLGEIATAFLPRGWFPAVVPGTRFVSLGGAIAADVHGKNHHAPGGGAFGDHLEWVEVMGADGTVRRLAPGDPGFAETCGGMGLTGFIARAALRLRRVDSGWLRQETRRASGLDAAMDLIEASHGWTHTSAWIDCLAGGRALGRAILYRAEDAAYDELPATQKLDRWALKAQEKRLGPPPDLVPGFALNLLTMRAFNALYWAGGGRAERAGPAYVDWGKCFHPLDAVLGWNRIYGRRGFVQFQCALPPETARAGLRAMLETTSAAGQGSFLAVLKALGPGREGATLSFPRRGWTLALDFPATPRAFFVIERLHRLTAEHGGRIYLAKDARMTAAEFEALEPRAPAFRASPARARAFATALARRLDL
ncbi:FAD-binding oxidoreductase [Albimonas sp. CAU 1670]|uniref:FAD-binding oxidoreductase n=1 Tax=Albimonas sp. CAU 1670 TaxID=3032599 RepID=UPI0023DAFD53|nr:FAD-binding oxidoreductase [Albimonas sp. CAU 1670]MDF2234594.1 FAD-binding oxidoreductase [Albimonas sp. CAU 1670]